MKHFITSLKILITSLCEGHRLFRTRSCKKTQCISVETDLKQNLRFCTDVFKNTFIMLAALLSIPVLCSAEYNIGDVIGSVIGTDIKSYINENRISSYNINGRTAVVAQSLEMYGFSASFDEDARMLSLSYIGTAQNAGNIRIYDTPDEDVGKPVFDVYYTDIVTELGGTPLESFNIGGLTAVFLDDLAKLCGNYSWNEEARTVNVTLSGRKTPETSIQESERQLPSNLNPMTKDFSSSRWGESPKSFLIANADDSFYAVEICENINIEKYDSGCNFISSYAIPKELEIFGGMYVGEKYNYIAFGQPNYEEDNSREVIRIVIYDKNFIKISEIPISNCRTVLPFDASKGDMSENERYLILHTSRTQYMEEDGSCPQTQLTVIIDKKKWKIINELSKFQPDHTSHSLGEFALSEDDRFVTADLSDAVPLRGIILRALDFTGNVFGQISVFDIPGSLAANCTGVSVGSLKQSESGYLLSLNSIDHSLASGYNSLEIEGLERDDRDICLLYIKHDSWEIKRDIVYKYTGTRHSGSIPYLVTLGNDYFMLIWEEFNENAEPCGVRYVIVNGSGEEYLSSPLLRYSGRKELHLCADCNIVFCGGKVMWYNNSEYGRIFYSIEVPEEALNKEQNTVKQETQKEKNKEITEVEGI